MLLSSQTVVISALSLTAIKSYFLFKFLITIYLTRVRILAIRIKDLEKQEEQEREQEQERKTRKKLMLDCYYANIRTDHGQQNYRNKLIVNDRNHERMIILTLIFTTINFQHLTKKKRQSTQFRRVLTKFRHFSLSVGL